LTRATYFCLISARVSVGLASKTSYNVLVDAAAVVLGLVDVDDDSDGSPERVFSLVAVLPVVLPATCSLVLIVPVGTRIPVAVAVTASKGLILWKPFVALELFAQIGKAAAVDTKLLVHLAAAVMDAASSMGLNLETRRVDVKDCVYPCPQLAVVVVVLVATVAVRTEQSFATIFRSVHLSRCNKSYECVFTEGLVPRTRVCGVSTERSGSGSGSGSPSSVWQMILDTVCCQS
jgi:hypothetical protein